LKANIKDVLGMLDKKPNIEEVQIEINSIKSSISKFLKDYKQGSDEQATLNEILCAENCVARWLWKNGHLESLPSSALAGDIHS
jgi:hypothetical protein